MLFIMTQQITPAAKGSQILKLQSPGRRLGADNRYIKIYQMTVVHHRALGRIDAVRVMTDGTGGVIFQVFLMHGKTLISQNTVAAMTLVA